MEETLLSKHAAVERHRNMREIGVLKTKKDPNEHQIGGPGFVMEIDETKLYKGKYHLGRILAHEAE